MENRTNFTKHKRIESEIEISPEVLEKNKNIKNISEFKDIIESYLSKNTTLAVESLLFGSSVLTASDIHIEPEEESVKIRLRIDGFLHDLLSFDKKTYERILSRIKLISGLKLNVTDVPQDGRFSFSINEKESETRISSEVRVSVLPSENGETIVARILNPQNLIDIELLGLRKDLENLFLKEIKNPNGMIIVTGPTGSGKSTTLYGFLKKISSPQIKIITIEDPIEYHLENIVQTQTDKRKGYDFASGLKAIVRQDPDVILVGEIRDSETVEIALQAALTGHLVFSTLHTNDAAGTVTRLVSLGANPANIGPAINLIIAQRLARKICDKCATKEKSNEIYSKVKEGLKDIPKDILIPEISEDFEFIKANGCEQCNFTGYKGRIGIFEAIKLDEDFKNFIIESPYISALKKKMKEKGILTMYQDGLIKILNGKTTIEEIERVTREE